MSDESTRALALGRLQRRAAEVRSRALIRRWEYRQRHHSKGVWFRLRRVLAGSREVFIVSESTARALLAEGFGAAPVGGELVPSKTLITIPADRALELADKKSIPLRLSAELLAAPFLVLVPWERP